MTIVDGHEQITSHLFFLTHSLPLVVIKTSHTVGPPQPHSTPHHNTLCSHHTHSHHLPHHIHINSLPTPHPHHLPHHIPSPHHTIPKPTHTIPTLLPHHTHTTPTHLDGLPVRMENVDPDDGLVEVLMCRLNHLIVLMLHIVQSVKSSQHKVKHSAQVLRTW